MQAIASSPEAKEDLKSLPLPELPTRLGSSSDGLSHAEAQRQLPQYGYNELAEKKANPFLAFRLVGLSAASCAHRVGQMDWGTP